jgi:hypothetical protein
MKALYDEMQERLKYLKEQEETEEIKWRIRELTLAIVRVQQLLLVDLNYCKCEKPWGVSGKCVICNKSIKF